MAAQIHSKKIVTGVILVLAGGFWNHYGSGKVIWQSLSFFICLFGLIIVLRTLLKWWKVRKTKVTAPVEEEPLKNKLT